MKAKQLKQLYLKFFESKGHKIIPSASLIPENDPTVLFTTAGMHPLVPFIMGQPHPLGKRLTDVQKCLRTQDIDEVGDATHTTFFEMLGNWSLGDYFKKEAISWSFEFLTSKQWLGLDINRLAVTCFAGDENAPKDEEAANIWLSLGMPKERIAFLPKEDNWWGPAGTTGPCGPDTEMFYWKNNSVPAPKVYNPKDKGWVEIWNDVFMQYNKNAEGKYEVMAKQSVDTGLGVERVSMILQGFEDIYKTELFKPIVEKISEITGVAQNNENIVSFRIIADHMRASTFILGDERGVVPSNVDQGYILRRYIRRSIRHLKKISPNVDNDAAFKISTLIIDMYKDEYPILFEKKHIIEDELKKEQDKFTKTLETGLREFERISSKMKEFGGKELSGKTAFLLFQSYGFPIEMTEELAKEAGMTIDRKGFNEAYAKHQELSRLGSEQKFKGGLSEASEITTRYHTATHLLNEALRRIISEGITQKGSNITAERMRFDFNFDRKLTDVEKQAVEDEVNRVISLGIPVIKEEMTPEQAKHRGAQAEFGSRYPEKVSVYFIADYSKEICMGPHVANTKDIGKFKIQKEESSAAGIRRIKAVLE